MIPASQFCSVAQAISVSEGARFSQPRATPSLYYTSRVRPRPACPAGERGWKATTETGAHPDPVRLVRTVNEIRQLAQDRPSSSPT